MPAHPGFSPTINPDVLETSVEPSRFHEMIKGGKRILGRAALILSMATAPAIAIEIGEAVFAPTRAEATTFVNDYPDMDATDCSAIYGIYSWCKSGGPLPYRSNRGYDYRNCTDGASYWTNKYTGVNVAGWGNANTWDDNATAYNVKAGTTNSIEPGDIAQSDDGGFGHVGFVTSVTKNGDGSVASINVAELNRAGTGEYSFNTYSTRNASGKFSRGGSNDWDHYIDVNGTGIGLSGDILGGGGSTGGPQTIGLYNPSNSTFYERNSNTPGPADMTVPYGNANWIPLAGDWNNDKVFTPGAYDPNTGTFYLSNSNVPGGPPDTPAFTYGNIGWIPIAGDWDGNGYWSIGMYDSNTSTFYLRNTNSAGAADYTFNFGNAGWKPITGDWDGHDDGNSATTIGVYNPNTATYYLNNENDSSAAESTIQYGNIGWTPIAGDWDGNSFSSIGAYDPNSSTFYLRNSNSPGPADITVQYGNIGWKPVIGDWDAK